MKSGLNFFARASLALILSMALSASSLGAEETADLRGYGKVSADLAENRAVFACESVEKADLLLDKLLADLFWDETVPPQKGTIQAGSATLTTYSLAGQGTALIVRAGKSVIILGGADESQVSALAAKEPLLNGADITSQPAKTHPIYLDYYDNTSFKSYVMPMRSLLNYGLESHWPFLKSFKGAETFDGPSFSERNPAPNVVELATIDYEMQEALRVGGGVEAHLWCGQAPLWAYNASPEQMMKASDTTLLGGWGGSGAAGAHYLAWTMQPEMRANLDLGYIRLVMERYRDNPMIQGWHFEAGAPGAEYGFHDKATRSWDTSVAGQESWRHWLQESRHYSLSDLGTRWYGDPGHFSNWGQVQVPDANEFFGQLGPDSFRLQTGWQTQNVAALETAPDGAKWVPVDMPPSQAEVFLPRSGANYFQNSFDPVDWLKQQQDKGAKDIWLVLGGIGTGTNSARIWLNGTSLDLPKDLDSSDGPFAVRVTDALKPGPNQLEIGLAYLSQTGRGRLAGPVFLTVHEPKRLPYLGREANARNVDFIEWQNWAMYEHHREVYELARRIDPDRPFRISPGGGAVDDIDYASQLAVDYGVGCENTGREAYYAPWWPGLGLLDGFYATSEWSATPPKVSPKGDMLDRGFGWILFDADSCHSLFYDIESFIQREKEDGWFTRHRRQIELFGKYLREQPRLVLLRSAETIRLHSEQPHLWDVGRGELQSIHYDCIYSTERELKAGLVDKYPVLMDTGSEFMEPEVVAAIRKYVEQGGTFIALHNTGIHTSLVPDSDPLAEVSGFKVVQKEKTGTITFEQNLPILKGWEGKQFTGQGSAIDHMNNDSAIKSGISLAPADNSAIPLARWDDGSIAVGYRQLGKGRIIVLGSTFWRNGKDVSGVWISHAEIEGRFLERLLTDCGIDRRANATAPEIWTRKMVTKNGLQHWLVTFNSTNLPVKSDVWMAADAKPDQVYDLQTNTPVPFVFENKGVSIKGVDFNPYEVKFYGTKQSSLVSGLAVWWHEKTTYWKRTDADIAASTLTLPEGSKQTGVEATIPLNSWSFKTDPDNAISAQTAWTATTFDDASWKTVGLDPWAVSDPSLKDYRGTGLYRVKFTVPPDWKGRRILLSLYSWDNAIVYDQGDFFVNGTAVTSYKAKPGSQTLNYDITDKVHPGENILALKAIGGATWGGIAGTIWIEAWKPMTEPIDLSGPWQVVGTDGVTRQPVTMPGSADGKCLSREIEIPAGWKGKSVFLEWSSEKQWVSGVVVNGSPINYNAYLHPFGIWSRVNLTPLLKPGEKNTIELWPRSSMTTNNPSPPQAPVAKGMGVTEIRVGLR